MEFRTLEVFLAVATLRSFARAADTLRMTQSAVSQRIASLEAEVGERLLDRSSRGASLTQKGEILLHYAERLLKTRAELIQSVAAPQPEARLIRLGVAETIAQTWLPSFIGSVNARYPFVTFEIEVDVSASLRSRVVRQEIDLAFLLGKAIEPGITSIDLCSYPLRFVASSALSFPQPPVPLEALGRHALISFPKSTVPYRDLQEMFQERALRVPRIHASSSVSTIIKMTLDRIGICVIAPILIRQELHDGRLVVLETDMALPTLDFTASFGTAAGGPLMASVAQIARQTAGRWA